MTDTTQPGHAPAGTSRWIDLSRDSLQLIAEGVTETAGFGVAAISVARDDGYLHVTAVAGNEDARRTLKGHRTAIDELMDEVAKGDDWGLLTFVPHERMQLEDGQWGWVPDIVPLDEPDAWHPLDLLVALLYDTEGVLRGTLTIDLPEDGRRPSPAQRRLLNRYAAQTGRAVLTILEREELADQVRLAEAARLVVRRASVQRSLPRILEVAQPALVEGFRAAGMWIQTVDEDGLGHGKVHANNGSEIELPAEIVRIAERAARAAWHAQAPQIVTRGRSFAHGVTEAEGEQIFAFLDSIEIGSLLFVPIGVGDECLGNLVLTRAPKATVWSETEASAALDIGRDLGSAILNARAFEREHRLVEQLQELDTYKSQLIATVSHELKNPLTSILGHLEILESVELERPVRTSLSAMERGARRLGRVVDDLLLLSKVGDPGNPLLARAVDMRSIVDDVVDMVAVSAARGGLKVEVAPPEQPLHALGDAVELDRVVSNLVSNAVKYTPEGGSIRITLARQGDEVVLTCADDGLGISADDQQRLFREFFRSTNPEAVARPGTGLGLAIVRRIVERHGGRIEVESELGRGSCFRVFLPAA
ncbi:sensor histidine kinase [Nocardioides pantholopis]|uniref:sensor histidine kinase n=1 Tax=Nocardioides pantholopis TaxID=2483798 RepID=UPI000F0980EC|nr:HAMP domain-containing sensor histidine kinase [Nocardioides pantholopis]